MECSGKLAGFLIINSQCLSSRLSFLHEGSEEERTFQANISTKLLHFSFLLRVLIVWGKGWSGTFNIFIRCWIIISLRLPTYPLPQHPPQLNLNIPFKWINKYIFFLIIFKSCNYTICFSFEIFSISLTLGKILISSDDFEFGGKCGNDSFVNVCSFEK